jgi:uncharacterized damage-inducible protein DinB
MQNLDESKGDDMSLDTLITSWKEVRTGLISEVEQIPVDQFSFRASPETRSISELIQHVIEAQKFLVGETCRAESNLMRQHFTDHLKEYAPDVRSVTGKDGLLDLLGASMEETETSLRALGDRVADSIMGFDGKPRIKSDFLNFVISHEMYHRGQLTVYERLIGIEPQLTQRLKKFFAQAAGS